MMSRRVRRAGGSCLALRGRAGLCCGCDVCACCCSCFICCLFLCLCFLSTFGTPADWSTKPGSLRKFGQDRSGACSTHSEDLHAKLLLLLVLIFVLFFDFLQLFLNDQKIERKHASSIALLLDSNDPPFDRVLGVEDLLAPSVSPSNKRPENPGSI